MVYGMYAIQDVKTGFMAPICDMTDMSAARNFESTLIQAKGTYGTHAQDFRLYRVGDFDVDSGELKPVVPIQLVYDGASFVPHKKDVSL